MPPVIIIGTPRGGTSAVAGVVEIFGFRFSGSGGYNEDPDLRFWKHNSNEIRASIALRMKAGRPWGWKDALMVQYLDQALQLFPEDSRFVYVSRSPKLITESMFKHKPHPRRSPQEMLIQNQEWQTKIMGFMADHPGFYVGDFDEFRKNPEEVISRLADWLPGDKTQIERAKRYIGHNTYTDPNTAT